MKINIGKFVIVRCRDAGVHAGFLVDYEGRTAVLNQARRLWYWGVPQGSPDYLSGVSLDGLAAESEIGAPLDGLVLTETCEIIPCTEKAQASIQAHPIARRQ